MGFWGDEHEFTQRVSIQLTDPSSTCPSTFSCGSGFSVPCVSIQLTLSQLFPRDRRSRIWVSSWGSSFDEVVQRPRGAPPNGGATLENIWVPRRDVAHTRPRDCGSLLELVAIRCGCLHCRPDCGVQVERARLRSFDARPRMAHAGRAPPALYSHTRIF